MYCFDRIDLSNITGSIHSGSKIVTSFAPFLRIPKKNLHIKILSHYFNALGDSLPFITAATIAQELKFSSEIYRRMPLTSSAPGE
jgi:hypothetical protein